MQQTTDLIGNNNNNNSLNQPLNRNSQQNRKNRNSASSLQATNPHTKGAEVPASRTLFIRNVKFDTLVDEVKDKFESFGDIKQIFDLIAKRGLVFITFHDLRSAENAMAGSSGLEFKGRKSDVHYSIPKEGDAPEKAQASLLAEYSGLPSEFVTHELYEFMSKFGEVRSIRDNENLAKKSVSFWDTRACTRALESLTKDPTYGKGTLSAVFYWDEGQEEFADKVKPSGQGGHNQNQNQNQNNQGKRLNNGNGGNGNRDKGGGGREKNRHQGKGGRDRSASPDRGRRDRDDRKSGGRREDDRKSGVRRDDDRRRGDRDEDRRRDRGDDRRRSRDYQDTSRDVRGQAYMNMNPAQPVNLMDILSNSKAVLQPVQSTASSYAGGYNPPPLGFPGVPPTLPQTLLGNLLQGQTGGINPAQAQQLMTLLGQIATEPQQGQQNPGINLGLGGGIPNYGFQNSQQQGQGQRQGQVHTQPPVAVDPRTHAQQPYFQSHPQQAFSSNTLQQPSFPQQTALQSNTVQQPSFSSNPQQSAFQSNGQQPSYSSNTQQPSYPQPSYSSNTQQPSYSSASQGQSQSTVPAPQHQLQPYSDPRSRLQPEQSGYGAADTMKSTNLQALAALLMRSQDQQPKP